MQCYDHHRRSLYILHRIGLNNQIIILREGFNRKQGMKVFTLVPGKEGNLNIFWIVFRRTPYFRDSSRLLKPLRSWSILTLLQMLTLYILLHSFWIFIFFRNESLMQAVHFYSVTIYIFYNLMLYYYSTVTTHHTSYNCPSICNKNIGFLFLP
jgi:hypothetical protein